MANAFDKNVKQFLDRFQKDLGKLQKTLKQESDELVKKVKTATTKESLNARRKEVEKLVEQSIKKYEPTINKFVHELNTTAKKAGVDLTDLEKKVRENLHSARSKLAKASATAKKVKTKAAAKAKAAAGKTESTVAKGTGTVKKKAKAKSGSEG